MKVIKHIVNEMNEAVKEKALHFNIDPNEIKWAISSDHDKWIMDDLIPLWYEKGEDAVRDEIEDSFNVESIISDLHDAIAGVVEDKEADDNEVGPICEEITNAFTVATLTLTNEDKEELVNEFKDIAWAHFVEVQKAVDEYGRGSCPA